MTLSVAEGSPAAPWAAKPVPEHGAPSAGFVIPNGRRGRTASPHAQGREAYPMFIGIDVAKERLGIHLRPGGEAFTVSRDSEGVEALAARLLELKPVLVVLEATGGFEVV